MSNLKPQASKLLKYGLGVFAPERPQDADWEALTHAAPAHVTVPDGAKGAVVEIPSMRGMAGAVYVRIGAGSEATLIERGADEASDLRVEIEIGECARVRYLSLSGSAPSRIRRRARLAASAEIEWLDGVWDGSFHRALTETRLEGEGASAAAHQLIVGSGARFVDVRHAVWHLAPRTSSDLQVRTILGGESQAIVRGLVRIEKDASGCKGRQKQEALLLSDDARLAAIPDLEILNDQVECGHAATAGRLDREKLFYLMSRGLDRASSERALVEGFAAPFLARLPDLSARARLEEALEEALA